MSKFTDFYEAWWYLNETDIFDDPRPEMAPLKDIGSINIFEMCLEIQVVKVNPETLEIDDNEDLNTKIRVWLECGRPFIDYTHDEKGILSSYHTIKYDTGGDTFEEAIINLANIVNEPIINLANLVKENNDA